MSEGNLQVLASGRVHFAAGVPSWTGRHPGFLTAITDTGVGDVSVSLEGGGCDENQCTIMLTPHSPLAASGMVSFGVTHTSDIVKKINIWQEQAAGAASAAADVDFDILVVKRLTP